jgi:xanthine dehydrogenase iron-sulfur cluster and FAD-binding subunit A
LTVIPFSFTVSGTPANVVVAPHTPLLWVLREHLKLTGTKYGCGVGYARASQMARLYDAGTVPTVVSGNTNAAAVMIGEKGADLVLADAVAGAPIALSA